MVGWYHRLDGDEFEWTLGVGDGQGGLECCGPWGREELDMTDLFRMDWLDLRAVQGLSRVFSDTTVQNLQFFGAQLSL